MNPSGPQWRAIPSMDFVDDKALRHDDHAPRALERVGMLAVSAQAAVKVADDARREFERAGYQLVNAR